MDGSQYYRHTEHAHLRCAPHAQWAWQGHVHTSLVKSVQLDTLKGKKNSIEFYSRGIIVLLSNVLKEPKFQISECIKVSQPLYERVRV